VIVLGADSPRRAVSPLVPAPFETAMASFRQEFFSASTVYAASHNSFDFQGRILILTIVALHQNAPT
jgi:hypothetical protein